MNKYLTNLYVFCVTGVTSVTSMKTKKLRGNTRVTQLNRVLPIPVKANLE